MSASSPKPDSAQEAPPKIILYHYYYSPYAHKISWYLSLRGIPYQECLQPPILPRPDLSLLGITYRRIPLLAIGNDVYCDTHLILRELERRFPANRLDTAPTLSVEFAARSSKMFPYAAGCLPSSLPLMKDPGFLKDRAEFSGKSYKKEDVDAARPRALTGVRKSFEYMETQVLADDRSWVLGTELTLADIEAVWPLEWVISLPGALAGSDITAATFPKTFAYVARFMALLSGCPVVATKIKGVAAAEAILSYGTSSRVVARDSSGLHEVLREEVEVTPIDTGKAHPQCGIVSVLNKEVVVVEVVPTGQFAGRGTLQVHFPREGYQIKRASDSRL